ncbi:MAG TPA: CDP-alcohol phosphatidyltransferase family protein [Candidatus Paceibacterota bacterium]|nr:CDP-alcohol phosphatidyltransferase family protein [Verrucomicrobiota bacterium]HSA08876.1 CDP-alcohol phosphatidyltransferase family protein [Candidatus Paceibacterota bacterium]
MASSPGRHWKFYFVQALTLVRAPLIFLFLAVSVFCGHPLSELWFIVAFAAMILSAVTDLFDGYFARKFQVTSRLGSYADPMIDKVFYLTTFPTLIYLAARVGQHAHASALLVLAILFLLRDQWVSFLRSLGALHNLSAKANWSGKARTLISFPTICVIYYFLQAPVGWRLQFPEPVVYGLEGLSVVINLISIGVYTLHYWPALRTELRLPDEDKPPGD